MAPAVPTTLVAFGDEDGDEAVGPLRVLTLGRAWYVRGQRSNPVSLRLFGLLREADVVHCHQHHVLASSLAALWSRAPRTARVRQRPGWRRLGRVGLCVHRPWFHGHLHLSEYSRRVFGHAANARARVVGGGVDTTKFSPGSVGAARRRRAVRRPAGAAQRSARPDRGLPPDVPLTIVAPRPEDDGARASWRRWPPARPWPSHSTCPTTALVREYRRAQCVVLPSVYRSAAGETKVPELLGQTLLEGMACEAADAVCTRVASMPEMVQDGITGFVVPPNDPRRLASAWLAGRAPAKRPPRWAAPAAAACWSSSRGRRGGAVPRRVSRRTGAVRTRRGPRAVSGEPA